MELTGGFTGLKEVGAMGLEGGTGEMLAIDSDTLGRDKGVSNTDVGETTAECWYTDARDTLASVDGLKLHLSRFSGGGGDCDSYDAQRAAG